MAVKESLQINISKFENPPYRLQSNYKPIHSKQVTRVIELPPKLQVYKIKHILGQWHHGLKHSWKEEVILSRNRIGHTYITHSFLLRKEYPSECKVCQEVYTTKYSNRFQ